MKSQEATKYAVWNSFMQNVIFLVAVYNLLEIWANAQRHNVMASLTNIGGALCSTSQSLATRVPCSKAAKSQNSLTLATVL